MGASKRLAEMSVQAAASLSSTTIFTMVRFENVIGSSGLAIPLFQSQILNGGPVTVTDANVTRYFMSISEAVKLVLEAGEMANGGKVFVFDMGQPVKVVDLVKRMIRLHGKVEKLQDSDNGDIKIKFIGLRPGEKMFEELVLGRGLKNTKHPQILRAYEAFASKKDLKYIEKEILNSIFSDDDVKLNKILTKAGVLIK
jgi:FlaA1/EpsC-like NDP-sugar epimerase